MANWLIKGACVVNDGESTQADVRIANKRIAEVGDNLRAKPQERIFDAQGLHLLPGLIDDQVHFREPGFEHKATIASESRAAVAGGITSYLEMPNTSPQTTNITALRDKQARASLSSVANYAFYLGATNDNIEEIRKITPQDACGIKVFMGASTGNMLVDDPKQLEAIFRDAPLLIATHCEDMSLINRNVAEAKSKGPLEIAKHPLLRSTESCLKSSMLAVELAKSHDARLHVLHISSAEEIALFNAGPIEQKRITAETCVHFLHFDARDYAKHGNFIKCNPAIKFEKDRLALIEGVADGRLSILATDHAPHTLAEKMQEYERAPAGLPLVQHALLVALDLCATNRLTLTTVVERFCHAPAKLFGIKDRGYIREGFYADLTLVDLSKPQPCKREDVLSQCGWSPFENHIFRSTVEAVWVNGHLAWRDGKLDDSERGLPLEIARGRA